MFLDFYKFLTTLHYDPSDLKVPPAGGWQGFTPEARQHFRNDYAIEVLRHLPYLNSSAEFHFNTKLLDYTTFATDQFTARHQDQDEEEWWSTNDIVDAEWMLPLAEGYASHGHDFTLNVMDGEVVELLESVENEDDKRCMEDMSYRNEPGRWFWGRDFNHQWGIYFSNYVVMLFDQPKSFQESLFL